eukprot:TRINITY_DN2930_c0_g1_i1.p4 TRINITY_DN2930_c0_g1~~TRINITY_DN2930_c0_g1_i1.p4  ORF type:complete len:111 (-),score=11.73 TRINITY_DN2930_c0_g1_i1:585-917(-)
MCAQQPLPPDADDWHLPIDGGLCAGARLLTLTAVSLGELESWRFPTSVTAPHAMERGETCEGKHDASHRATPPMMTPTSHLAKTAALGRPPCRGKSPCDMRWPVVRPRRS